VQVVAKFCPAPSDVVAKIEADQQAAEAKAALREERKRRKAMDRQQKF
jgi:hypothetical protein